MRTLMLVSVLLAVVLVRNESPLAAQNKKPAELKFSDKKQAFTEVKAGEKPPALDCTGETGADAKTVRAAQVAWAKYLGEKSHEKAFSLTKDSKVTVEMCLLPPGKYYRGSPNGEPGRFYYEYQLIITLTQPLWVSRYEVTQKQFEAVMGNNPSKFKKEGYDAAHYPVEKVTHDDSVKFTQKASEETGAKYRLLTEAEWEYAYRAGTRTKFYNGESDSKLGEIAQYGKNNHKNPEKVGTKLPNAFGLFDMAGNVLEWCSDYMSPKFDGTTTDPRGPETGSSHAIRGGSYFQSAEICRAAYRGVTRSTSSSSDDEGFRLARVPFSSK